MSTKPERDQLYAQRKSQGALRLVSDGDSWFDYPFHSNLLDFVTSTSSLAILRCEHSGDTIETIAGETRFRKPIDKEKPRALLISGGGNDLAHDWWLEGLFRDPAGSNDPMQCLVASEWQKRRQQLRESYEHILEAAESVPVIGHGYDYFVPSNAPVRIEGVLITGPWFYPAMTTAKIPPPLQREVARKIVNDFNAELIDLAGTSPRFHHIDLRDTLVDKDWINEIHPSESGFRKLARKYLPQLRDILTKVPV
jgi:hypothetical protein